MEEEEKKKIQFVIHNFNTSNAPQYVEKASRAGYIFYGEDNLYPDYLISLMNRSAKHNAILKRKAMMIGGNGWNLEGLDGIANQFVANPYNELSLNVIPFIIIAGSSTNEISDIPVSSLSSTTISYIGSLSSSILASLPFIIYLFFLTNNGSILNNFNFVLCISYICFCYIYFCCSTTGSTTL